MGTPLVMVRSACAASFAGKGLACQLWPAFVVSLRARQAPAFLQGTVPSAQPVLSETKVTDRGWKALAVGAASAAGVVAAPRAMLAKAVNALAARPRARLEVLFPRFIPVILRSTAHRAVVFRAGLGRAPPRKGSQAGGSDGGCSKFHLYGN